MSPRRAALAVVAALALAVPAAWAQDGHDHGHDHPQPEPQLPAAGEQLRVGLLLADHGEPPEYNEDTYWSFRDFVDGLLHAGVIPPALRYVDTGTITHDVHGHLIDAWLRPHEGPGLFVPESSSIAAHHVVPGGPGLGEPDIFEHAGLQTRHEYSQMGGRSPNYDEKLPRTDALLDHLETRYGDRLAVRVGSMIDPRIGVDARASRRRSRRSSAATAWTRSSSRTSASASATSCRRTTCATTSRERSTSSMPGSCR